MGKHMAVRAQGRTGAHSHLNGEASLALGPGTRDAISGSQMDSGPQQSRLCMGQKSTRSFYDPDEIMKSFWGQFPPFVLVLAHLAGS